MPFKTYIATEKKSIAHFKASKDRLTPLLGVNTPGDLKLKPMLIDNFKNPRTVKNYAKSTLPVLY